MFKIGSDKKMELTLEQALQKGVEAHKAGKVQEADRYYTAILKANPKHPDANHNMGVLAVGVGKVEQALPFFKAALEVNQTIAQFWLSYIDALIKLDRLTDARATLSEARKKGAKGDGLDDLYKRLGQLDHTPFSSLEAGSNQNSERSDILSSAKHLQASGEYDQAIDLLRLSMDQFPKDSEMPALVSHCYILKNDMKLAADYLNKAKKIDPDNILVGLNEARLLRKAKDFAKATNIAKIINKKFPDNVEGMGVLASCLRATNNIDESLTLLNRAIELNPNNPDKW